MTLAAEAWCHKCWGKALRHIINICHVIPFYSYFKSEWNDEESNFHFTPLYINFRNWFSKSDPVFFKTRVNLNTLDHSEQNTTAWSFTTALRLPNAYICNAYAPSVGWISGPSRRKFHQCLRKLRLVDWIVGLGSGPAANWLPTVGSRRGPRNETCRRRRHTITRSLISEFTSIRAAVSIKQMFQLFDNYSSVKVSAKS